MEAHQQIPKASNPRGERARSGRLLAILLALVLVAAGCDDDGGGGGSPGAQADGGGTVVIALAEEPTGFNVNTPDNASPAAQAIVRTLWPSAYRIRPDFTPEPYVLDGPAEVVSEDPFVVEWSILDDAEWSDGAEVSADDFEFVWESCNGSDPDAQCDSTTGYEQITDLEKVDEKTVRATFDPPYVEYESLFRNLPPAHVAAEREGGWNAAFSADPGPSAGPFRLDTWTKGESMTLVRNDDWWGPAPDVDKLVFRFLPDEGTQPDALRNGEVDVIFPSAEQDLVETVEDIPGVDTQFGLGPDIEQLTFNTAHEFLAMPEVRRAVALAVDRPRIVEALVEPVHEDAERLDNRVFVVNQRFYEAHGEAFAGRDVEAAARELESAGFRRGSDGIWRKDGEKLSLRLSTTSGQARRERQVQLIQSQLADFGVEAEIDNAPLDTFRGRVGEGDFDVANFAWFGDPFPIGGVQAVYTSDGFLNFGGFSDEQVDALVAEAAVEADAEARAERLNRVDERLWRLMPNLPLYQPPSFLAAKGVEGVALNPTNEGHTWNVEEWRVVG